MIARIVVAAALCCALVLGAGPADAVIAPDTQCRTGQVSITFDDGPHPTNTPKLLRVLRQHRAQATFFVQGRNVKRYRGLVRAMVRDGHAVENHSWDHPQLTKLSNRAASEQISRTSKAIRAATGIRPQFMRPPFGDTNARIKRLLKKQRLRQELWTIDSNDWRGGNHRAIASAALKGLRPHRRNVILLHDAVANSAQTIKAVPRIVKRLRAKGYCLVPLQVTAPRSVLSGRDVAVAVPPAPWRHITVRLSLNTAMQRAGSVRVRTVDGSAIAGRHYLRLDRVIALPRGATAADVRLDVVADPMFNARRSFTLVLDRPNNVIVGTAAVPVTIATRTPLG